MGAAIPQTQRNSASLGFWASFEMPEVEAQFHRYYHRQERLQAVLALLLGMVTTLAFIPSDYRLFGSTETFGMLLAGRIGQFLFAAILLFLVYKEINYLALNKLLTVWAGLGALLYFGIGYTRPPAFFVGYIFTALVGLLILYFVLPLPLRSQVAIASLVALGDVYLLLGRHPEIDPLLRRAIVVSYLLTNLIGGLVSWNLHRLKRKQFHTLLVETGLREGLEAALSEVKTLRGFLPICAHCKAVRNDEGYWQQVDVYLREHSEAELTHGICPKCVEAHYGEWIRPPK